MTLKMSATFSLLASLLPLAAHAELPGSHPGYLHALANLHEARWNLEHRPGEAEVSAQEHTAISEIDRAIGEVKKTAHDDEKNLHHHGREEGNLNHTGLIHHAVDLLKKAQDELTKEEGNPEAREPKRRALAHINRAIEAVTQAEQHAS